MNWLFPSLAASLTGTLILSIVYFYLFISHRERFLLLWSSAWMIYSLRFGLEMAGLLYPSYIITASCLITGILNGFLLLSGAFELASKPFPKAWIAACIAGLVWGTVAPAMNASFITVNLPVYILYAAIFILTGITIIKAMHSKGGASALFTGICFIIWGIHRADYPFLRTIEWFAPWGFFINSILEFVAAIGMLLVFFEIQHSRLKKTGDAYNSIFNATSEAIFIHDAETGCIMDVNETATAMFGYNKDELTGYDVGKISADRTSFTHENAWQKIIQVLTDGRQFFEWLCKRKDGSLFWAEVSLKKFMSCDARAVLAVVRDISERKTADMAYDLSMKSLRRFFEEGMMIFVMLDEKGRLTFANTRFEQLSGWKIPEMAGCDWFEKFFNEPKDARTFFNRAVSGNGTYISTICENSYKTRNGHDRLMRWNCSPVYNEQGTCDGAAIIAEDMTEHRHAEEKKEFRNALLATVMETSIDGILVVDTDAKIIMSNRTFADIWKIPAGIMDSDSDEPLLEYVMSRIENPERFVERIKWLYAHPDEKNREEIRLRDGCILDRYSAPMIGSSGKYYGRAWYFRDITEQKNTENTLMERELQIRSLAENIPGVIYQFYARPDGKMGLYYVSDQSEKILGIPNKPLETFFERFTEQIHENYREAFVSSITEAVSARKNWEFEGMIIRTGGASVWFTGSSVPCEKNNEIVFNGMIFDITAKKLAEKSLKDNEKKFRGLFENMTEGVALHEIIYNEKGKPENYLILAANSAFTRHTGISSSEAVGKTGREIYRSEEAPFLDKFSETAETGIPQTFETFFPPMKKHFYISVFSPEKGQFATVFEDITQRKKDEAEHIEMERKMQHVQKLESLGVLAGGIAHDFNNILAAILGHADIALLKLPALSPARDSLAEIERAAHRASDLCRQMLAYSGRGKFIIEIINLEDIVREMAQLLKASISKKAILSIETENNIPAIKGDATQIRQILLNLVTNASDAIGEKNGAIKISTGSMYCSGDFLVDISTGEKLDKGLYVFMEVSDNGCGMDRDTTEKIFEPFFTTKFTGRGLGMAAVLGIIKGHHGGISIKSSPEEGSTFRILFPASGTPELDKNHEDHDHENESGNNRQKGTALVVDDEKAVRTVASGMLEMIGIKAIEAPDGIQALDIYRKNKEKIDFILLDLTMPGLGGEETLMELKQINQDVKVIISSGYCETEISEKLSGTKISGFIQKPFRIKNIADKVNEIMGN